MEFPGDRIVLAFDLQHSCHDVKCYKFLFLVYYGVK